MKDIIIAVLGAGGFLVTLIAATKEIWLKYLEQRKLKKHVQHSKDDAYQVLYEIITQLSADRVLILNSENGSGIPKIGVRRYSTVIQELNAKGMPRVKGKWTRQLLDEEYLKMLVELDKHGQLELTTSNLAPSMLRDAYEAAGIQKSVLFKIMQAEKEFFYLSVAFCKNVLLSAKEREVFRYCINELRLIYNKKL